MSERFREALQRAEFFHSKQLRKGTTIPYISHLMSVSALVMEMGGTEDQAIAALFHDTLEDQPQYYPETDIELRFGENVLRMVKECSDTEVHPKPPWKERKEAYINHLETIGNDTLMVSIADKLHNLRTLVADYKLYGNWIFSKFKGKKEGTLWYYRSLMDKYRIMLNKLDQEEDTVQKMQAAVTEMEGLMDWFNLEPEVEKVV